MAKTKTKPTSELTPGRERVLQRVYGARAAMHKVRFPWRMVKVKDRGVGTTPQEKIPPGAYAQFEPVADPIPADPVTHMSLPNRKDLSGQPRIVRSQYVTRDPEEIHYLDQRACTVLGKQDPTVGAIPGATQAKRPDGQLYILASEWVEVDEHGSVFLVED